MKALTRSGAAASGHTIAVALPLLVGAPAAALPLMGDACHHGAVFSFEPTSTEVKDIQSVHYTDANGKQGTIDANASQVVFKIPAEKIEDITKFAATYAECKAKAYLNNVMIDSSYVSDMFGSPSYVAQFKFFSTAVPKTRFNIEEIRRITKTSNIVSVIVD